MLVILLPQYNEGSREVRAGIAALRRAEVGIFIKKRSGNVII